MVFGLDPRLKADTHHVASLAMCELLVMNDCRYPWAVLVPRIPNVRELHELDERDLAPVMSEIMAVSAAIGTMQGVTKVNIGALGNIVAQLHIHIVGRNETDPAWPGPVWGHSARVDYEPDEVRVFAADLLACLGSQKPSQ